MMVGGSRELNFPFFPLFHFFFFSFTLYFVCLGLDLDRKGPIQLEMSLICWQGGHLQRVEPMVFAQFLHYNKIPDFNAKGEEEGIRKRKIDERF